MKSLLIANRAEIAIRIARAAAELGIRTVAIYSEDDARSLHIRRADDVRALRGRGPAPYLDIEQIIAIAQDAGCDAIHPGYGFLSESAAFARRCEQFGITFVGPRPEILDLLGDKGRARAFAESLGVPVLPGTSTATSIEDARAFRASLGDDAAVVIKAIAGGGGRGMRIVHAGDDLDDAYARCQSEALLAFGNGDVYVEQLLPKARHIEVQILGDGSGAVTHLRERDCTIQRRNQKLIEIAPAPGLPRALRDRLTSTAVRLAQELRYENIGTFEFLTDADGDGDDAPFYFIEANPRLQVEHTVTEAVTGVDIVQAQLQLAAGRSLADLALRQSDIAEPRGFAIQLRINMETMSADGTAKPAGGTIAAFEPPSGSGLRVDSFGYAGYTTNPSFDSLLAKLIACTPSSDFADTVGRAYRALCEFRIDGVATNIRFLQNLLQHPDFAAQRTYTRFVEDHAAELVAVDVHPQLFFGDTSRPSGAAALAGAKIDTSDPLAVLSHGKSESPAAAATATANMGVPDGSVALMRWLSASNP